MRLIRRARPLRKRDRIVIRYEFASPREHMRNKERHSSVGVESRLAGAGLSPSTTSALRSMRHGRRAGELEGLFAFITRLLPDCLVPGDERDREGPLQPAEQKDRQPHPLFEGGRRDRRGGRQRGHHKGYQVSKGHYIEITDEDLEAVAVESTRTIDIDQFVPREEIDDLYNIRPYFIAPEGKVGADAFVTIREAIAATGKVALGRLVLTTREHMIALETRGKGLMGTLLRYPYEVRDEADYFEDIPNIKIEKEMLDLAKHIVQTKAGHFEPDKFEDRYETALREVIKKKAKGEKIEATKPERPSNVINLMDALKQSLAAERGEKAPASAHGGGKASNADQAQKPAPSNAAKKARKAG